MESDNEKSQREILIALSDAKDPSPEDRAKFIWNLIKDKCPELTEWDLICFSANYLGMISQAFKWIETPAKHIVGLVYTAHYQDEGTDIESGIESHKRNITNNSEGLSKEIHDSNESRGFEIEKSGVSEIFTGLDGKGNEIK